MAERIAGDYVEEDLYGPGQHGFRPGDSLVDPPVLPTRITTAWLNFVQEELARTVLAAGIPLELGNYAQLQAAIDVQQAAKLAVNVTRRPADGSYSDIFTRAAFGDGYFALVGQSGEIQHSQDTIDWSEAPAAGAYTGSFTSVHYGGGVWVVCGVTGEIQSSAGTPTSFAHRTADASYASAWACGCYAASFSSPKHILVGHGGEIQTSVDGTTWTHRANAGGSPNLTSVASGGGVAIAVSVDTDVLITTDGITWVQCATTPGSAPGFPCSIAYDEARERFVLLGGGDWNLVSYDNGATWTALEGDVAGVDATTIGGVWGNQMAFGAGLTVVPNNSIGAGTSGIIVGKGLATWRLTDSGDTQYIAAVAYGRGRFVFAGASGGIFASGVVE